MYELQVESEFAAAHRLNDYHGLCENLHGHNWKVGVEVRGEKIDACGMLMDFKDLKKLIADIMAGLDHKYLNEVPPFDRMNPTTENLARHIAGLLAEKLPQGVSVARVRVWESSRANASYIPE